MKQYKHFTHETIHSLLSEMRMKNYDQIVSSICLQIRQYYKKLPNYEGKNPKLIVGLSGGIDSAVVSYLAIQAVGSENVITINMPAYIGDEGVENASLVSEILATSHYTIPIQKIVETEVNNMHQFFPITPQTETGKIRVGNYASRARVAVLYDTAREVNGKILGTGNRTEFVQGYAAKWGTPTSFDFGVLDQLYKVDVYAIADALGIPKKVIEAVPTTGYYKGQTHEMELGATLEEQDVAAYLLFEKGMSKTEIVRKYGASVEYLDAMLQRYSRSADKRPGGQKHVVIRSFYDKHVQ